MHPAEPGEPRSPAADLFRSLLEAQRDIILVLDDDGTIRYATQSASSLFGPGPVAGARLADLAAARPGLAAALERVLAGGQTAPGPEETWQVDGPGGQEIHLQVHYADLRADPAVGGTMITLRDVTGERRREQELRLAASQARHDAAHDTLTGLPNRSLFTERAARGAAAARSSGLTCAVLFIDLDDFKGVNDTLGHLAGDELLRAAAGRMVASVRGSDTVARLGGDEFAVLLEDLPDPASAAEFADRVVAALGRPFALAEGSATVRAGASVGIATSADAADVGGILHCADLALYAAKAGGKHGWRVYDPARTASMPGPARDWSAAVSDIGFPPAQPGQGSQAAGEASPGRRSRAARPGDHRGPHL